MKPLRLKREVYLQPGEITEDLPLAKVLVDTGIAHLDQPYDYLVPKKFEYEITAGSFVEVDFAGKGRTGLVLARTDMSDEAAAAKTIAKSIGSFPIVTNEILELASQTAKEFAGDFFSVLKSAIPDRVDSVDRKLAPDTIDLIQKRIELSEGLVRSPNKSKPLYLPLSDYSQIYNRVEKLLTKSTNSSQILLVVPDQREIAILESELSHLDPLILTSALTKSERYGNFLEILSGKRNLIVGTRSAIFAPVLPGSEIIVFNDQDPSMYEKRNPYWNVRDVALMRGGKHNLTFISSSPSLEVLALIKGSRLSTVTVKSIIRERKLKQFNPKPGQSYLSAIKDGLSKGNVLVTINDPGYISSFACGTCRNISRCECGGKLFLSKESEAPKCVTCQKAYANWHCEWCKSDRKRIVARGSEKLGEELGKSFPNIRILLSKGKNRVDILPNLSENALVISTYGCEPAGEYSTYIGLNLEFAFAGTKLRSFEETRLSVVDNLLKVSSGGDFFLDLPNEHPFIQAQLSGNFSKDLDLEIESRTNAKLPPKFRIASITGSQGELRDLQDQISKIDFLDKNSVLRSIADENLWELIVKSKDEDSARFSKFLSDLRRYRSLKKFKPFDIRVDPFSL
jgi:primosomal protein N' (replication factor Y) (superfamily II helicase)